MSERIGVLGRIVKRTMRIQLGIDSRDDLEAMVASVAGTTANGGPTTDSVAAALAADPSFVASAKGDRGDDGTSPSPQSVASLLSADATFRAAVKGDAGDDGTSPSPASVAGLLSADAAFRAAVKGDPGIQGPAGPDSTTYLVLSGNVANSTTTPAAATGLLFAALANTRYHVEAFGAYQSAATTTGIAAALDIPSGSVIGLNQVATTAAALGGTEQIADNATTGASTGVRAANANTPLHAMWLVSIGATPGNVQMMFRSEVAGSAVTLQGGLFFLKWRAIA